MDFSVSSSLGGLGVNAARRALSQERRDRVIRQLSELDPNVPTIYLMSVRRFVGKSSIRRVVFEGAAPQDVALAEETSMPSFHHYNSNTLMNVQLVDWPGGIPFRSMFHREKPLPARATSHQFVGRSAAIGVDRLRDTPGSSALLDEAFATSVETPPTDTTDLDIDTDVVDVNLDARILFAKCWSVVFVLDAQDTTEPFDDAVDQIARVIRTAHEVRRDIHFDVFVHKVDGGDTGNYFSDEARFDLQRLVQVSLGQVLRDLGMAEVGFQCHLTSIHEPILLEAMSRVVQKLVGNAHANAHAVGNLVDSLIANSAVDKAFLFDTRSKLFVATDSNPIDANVFALCTEFLDVFVDLGTLYGLPAEDSQERTVDKVYTKNSQARIELNERYSLTLRYLGRHLTLVCLVPRESLQQPGTFEHNVRVFAHSLLQLLDTIAVSSSS
ncbi:MAG: hypothetical protein MHM6MM_005797 [Cercozoa sp. M6MM]